MGLECYPTTDSCCGCIDVTTGTVIIAVLSVLRACGPLVYFLLPVCRDVHGGTVGTALLALKILELLTTAVHIIVSIMMVISLGYTDSQETERMSSTYVVATIAMVVPLVLYWALHFGYTCAGGCTFCTNYGASKGGSFSLQNGYNESQCTAWDTANRVGYLLFLTFPLCAAIEASLFLYFAAVVNSVIAY